MRFKKNHTRSQIIKTLHKELPYLKEKFGVKRLGIFGSFAQGRVTKQSDLDLLVEFVKPIGLSFIDLSEHLENITGRKTDILTPAGVKGIRVKEVAESIKNTLKYV